MSTKKTPNGKRGRGRGGPSKNPDGFFKSRLTAKQQNLLKTKLKSRMEQHGAHVTRSTGLASTATAPFILTDLIINALVIEIDSAACLYCKAGTICSHLRKNLCFPEDVAAAFKSLTETEQTTQNNRAQKAMDKVDRLQTRRFRIEEAARTEMATRKAARVKKLLARAVLQEADDWITKIIDNHIFNMIPST
jgi:hypothetical protein